MRVLARTLVDGINYIARGVRGSLFRRNPKEGGKEKRAGFPESLQRITPCSQSSGAQRAFAA